MENTYYKKYKKYKNKNNKLYEIQHGGSFICESNVHHINLPRINNEELHTVLQLLFQLLNEYLFILHHFYNDTPPHEFQSSNAEDIIELMKTYVNNDVEPKINSNQVNILKQKIIGIVSEFDVNTITTKNIKLCEDFNKEQFRMYMPAIFDSRNFSISILLTALLERNVLFGQTKKSTLFYITNDNASEIIGHIFTIDIKINFTTTDLELISIQSSLQTLINNKCNEHVMKGISEKLVNCIFATKQPLYRQVYAYAWPNMSNILVKKYNFVSACLNNDVCELTFNNDDKITKITFDDVSYFYTLLHASVYDNIDAITNIQKNNYIITFMSVATKTLNSNTITKLLQCKSLHFNVIEN